MAALTADEKRRVQKTIRELLRTAPMFSHRLVKQVVQREDLAEKRDAVAALALRMTKFIDGGPDDGKVTLDE
jgi:hypothetical protein